MVESKIRELESYGFPYVVVCGEEMKAKDVVFREANGKWDAINYGCEFVPKDTEVVVINDVDTTIHNVELALASTMNFDLVDCGVKPAEGPQRNFYAFADPLRERLHIFSSGGMTLFRKPVLDRLLPIPPCIAEDTYLLFKAMELRCRIAFKRDAYVTTFRTANATEEVSYKERTTLGILQALDYTRPPIAIRLFYRALPLLAILLMLMGENGRAWGNGITRASRLHVQGSNRTKF